MDSLPMTPVALAFMAASMLAVTGLVAWCFARILRGGRPLYRDDGRPDG